MMSRLRLVFCGTPQFAVPSLQRLLAEPDFEIVSIITQPDRPRGRGQEVSYSAVKEAGLAAGIQVHQPEKMRAPEVEQQLRAWAPEAIVIIAYGQIIPARLLPIPRLGWINLHASLLPKYRGAAPIAWAIANGETVTGNTSMRIDAGMDTGEMLLQQELSVGAQETAPELAQRLAQIGAGLMVQTLRGLGSGELAAQPQDHGLATYAPMLKREDGCIDWSRPAPEIHNRMRGFTPWPGAFTEFRGQTCHLAGRPYEPQQQDGKDQPPGTLFLQGGKLLVECGTATLLEVSHVKLQGRRQVSAAEFANGAHLQVGERFGKS
ncbi:MAG TPA: methionyl-tRNA formyltransferase [Candidatus Eremiobacteraceae bacterium]|nr:methionyl-tRNA formyltransferase [Candidatus Eremiobacteraceae bacterium]